MFMVASSVVSTILILNYHHRNSDTHEMSDWVRLTLNLIYASNKRKLNLIALKVFQFRALLKY